MEPATAARCPGCGYENNPYYRYCGMCGTPLRAGDAPLPAVPRQPPAPKMPAPERAMAQPAPRLAATGRSSLPITINGMSILGLSNDTAPEESCDHAARDEARDPAAYEDRPGLEASRDVQYLLEADQPRRGVRWGTYAAILLAAGAGALIWQWQTNGYPWEPLAREQAVHHLAKAAPATDAGASANSSPEMSPNPSPTSDPLATSSPRAAANEAATPSAPTPENQPSMTQPALAADSATSVAGASPEPDAASAPQKAAAVPAKKPTPAVQPVSAPPQAALSVAVTDPAHLFTEGEKYLYGDGVALDCDRAQKDLRTSAAHSYSPAESLLGTMYASGHCLGRDLPAAYRWYARALRHEPANTRISSDLQVLWGEMTAAERKAAQSGGQ